MSDATVTVVGIGADGWDGLGPAAREAVAGAALLVGGARHLDLVPQTASRAQRRAWPSPMAPLVDEIAGAQVPVCVLASGDPMLHGVGATLARRVAPPRLVVHPHVSAFALACARLGWPAAETELVSLVARPPELLTAALAPRRRVVVYATGTDGAATVARTAAQAGYGASRLVVLEELGGPAERVVESTAAAWGDTPCAALHVVALACEPEPGVAPLGRTPGLPDDAFEHDGQITKRDVRAVTLAALAPLPGELLWDVGAGSGSVAIEWSRTHRSCRAVAVESRADRAQRIAANARRLGVPQLEVVEGRAPAVLDALPAPDAVFVGGGVTTPGLLDRCRTAIAGRGRLVATAVTLEGERELAAAHAEHGGRLVRLALSHAEPLGSYTTWRPALPVVQWTLDGRHT